MAKNKFQDESQIPNAKMFLSDDLKKNFNKK